MEERNVSNSRVSCKDSVMSRIQCGEVCPRSRRFFQTRECFVWALWALSVLVGALASAVILAVVSHRQYALYEATHDNFFTFMVEVLPFIWLLVFGLMVVVGVYNLRHTKHGYRYPLWQILASSLVLSLVGGGLLQFLGFGYMADHMLGERMGMYDSQEKIEKRLWQNPGEGRLIGVAEGDFTPPATTVLFKDTDGGSWSVRISDLPAEDVSLLMDKKPVRILGVATSLEPAEFIACGILPLRLSHEYSRDDLRKDREHFKRKMREIKDHIKLTDREGNNPCADLSILNKY